MSNTECFSCLTPGVSDTLQGCTCKIQTKVNITYNCRYISCHVLHFESCANNWEILVIRDVPIIIKTDRVSQQERKKCWVQIFHWTNMNQHFCSVFLVALSSQVMVPDNNIIIHTYLVTVMTKFPDGTQISRWYTIIVLVGSGGGTIKLYSASVWV